jgi:hypothetical protein
MAGFTPNAEIELISLTRCNFRLPDTTNPEMNGIGITIPNSKQLDFLRFSTPDFTA